MAHPIETIMRTTMENLKDMIDVDTVVGSPVSTGDGLTIVPVSRVSFGFVAGGGEYTVGGTPVPLEVTDDPLPFAGGTGAGVSVNPVAFLIVGGGPAGLAAALGARRARAQQHLHRPPDRDDPPDPRRHQGNAPLQKGEPHPRLTARAAALPGPFPEGRLLHIRKTRA